MTVWSRLCGAWAPLLGPFVVIVILVTASLGRRYLHGTLCDSDSDGIAFVSTGGFTCRR